MSVPVSKVQGQLVAVVRYGMLDNTDAADQIDTLIEAHGTAWFGKYGLPLSQDLERRVLAGSSVAVVLLRKLSGKEGSGYKVRVYKALSLTKRVPKDGEYPAYYRRILPRIGQWIKLAPYEGLPFELKDLIVKSSASPLMGSLSSSLRGHFLCQLRS